MVKPRIPIPMPSSSTSSDTYVSTFITTDAMTEEKVSIGIEIEDKVLDAATIGLNPYVVRLIQRQSKQNTSIISKYIIAMNAETNPSVSHTESQIKTLCYLSNSKAFFKNDTDVLQYLDSHRRPEEFDPLHKWVGTYNLRRAHLLGFFKWLYYPELESGKRPYPDVVRNISSFKRREQSIYKPTDLWTEQDDELFLKYCPNKHDRCYHMMAHDSSCRPSEILGLN
jgi:hypothetical protein